MKVIVDSGSTKADWLVGNSVADLKSFSSIGLNPVFRTASFMEQEARNTFSDFETSEVQEVYFYGAGCWDGELKEEVRSGLQPVFTKATIFVMHDLLGAARAVCGKEKGIACIIGTGSNSCLYDGEDVIDNVTNLGYLLGDEGSGTHLGKYLIRAYFYRELPKELDEAFNEWLPGGKKEVLDKIYGPETPNVFLASLTKFLSQHKDHLFTQKLVYDCFAEFIERHVMKYAGAMSLPVHFIGSVAYHFQDVMRVVLSERSLQSGRFIQKPIHSLAEFHFG